MATTSRHRRSSPLGLLPVVGSALLGAALGAGAVTVTSAHSLQQILLQGTSSSTVSSNTVASNTVASNAVTSNAVSSNTTLPQPSQPVRLVDPVALATPMTDAAGMSMTVLRPEKIKGGVRLTIALVNTSDVPITVDTGAVGPHDPRFNNTTVPMTMTPVRKKLVPGEAYTYQCVFKLPTMDVGQLAFVVGTTRIVGQAAGD